MDAYTAFWIVTAIIVLIAVMTVAKYIRMFIWAFAISFGVVLYINIQQGGDGGPMLATLVGGMALASPARWLIFKRFLG